MNDKLRESVSYGKLVEHFFRHESANLIAVLSRAFGIGRLDLIEDMVQAAMLEAMHAWKHNGVPANPAGWIHRVARNRTIDSLRREKIHEKALAFSGQTFSESEALVDEWLESEQIPDSLLRMMFVCCHESLDRQSQVSLTLKVLCGFGINEIARGLLVNKETIKKRIQRAKKKLADLQLTPQLPEPRTLPDRLSVVHDVLYLMFNEGYSTSQGMDPIRDDLCEESARLCHLLCESDYATATTYALLSLMLFHAARLESRVDENRSVVLLADQDRSSWDHSLIQVAENWLARSGEGPISEYHLQAGIAMQHCRAKSVDSTNWAAIVRLYDQLVVMNPSPVLMLNRSIARAQTGKVNQAMAELNAVSNHKEMTNYYLLDCTRASFHELNGDNSLAIDCYLDALNREIAPHERVLLEKKIARLTK